METPALSSISIVPASGTTTPRRIFSKVDLPAPFSPRSAWISPLRRVNSTYFSAGTPPNAFEMPRMRTMTGASTKARPAVQAALYVFWRILMVDRLPCIKQIASRNGDRGHRHIDRSCFIQQSIPRQHRLSCALIVGTLRADPFDETSARHINGHVFTEVASGHD